MRVWEDKESGVKKHRVSYITGAALIAGLVFMLLCTAMVLIITIVYEVEFEWEVGIIFIFCSCGYRFDFWHNRYVHKYVHI